MVIVRTTAVIAVAAATLAACSPGEASRSTPRVVDPCGAIGPSCTRAGAGSVADGGALQGIAVVEGVDGSAELRVVFGDGRGVASAVVPRAQYVYSEAVTSDVALYDLDDRPGAEVVVGRGSDGTHAWFGVYTFDGRRLVPVPGPRDVEDSQTGMWKLLVGARQSQIVCGDSRVTVRAASQGDDYFACRDELTTRVDYRSA
ncbi:hypothetical protein nbrc107696_20540 [Gordonia spumicola]|uniref:Lipoprotein n=1 Tax=Gordonia spumicola TaxID=589161 RepID=A0A7I9V895_9ACTN|nr:hypothetical protein [Gordonia spumicola]GEE01608.1 hypothetical protein nbrc107696_20540 [Gordonia spumicola]